jgi:hypothetical protein
MMFTLTPLQTLVFCLFLALPLTTLLAALLVVFRIWRRRRGARRTLLTEALLALVALAWLGGAVPMGMSWFDSWQSAREEAAHHFTTEAPREIQGIALPAGTKVNLNGFDRLDSLNTPGTGSVTVGGIGWRGEVVFASPDPDHPHPAVVIGTLASDTTISGIACRGGEAAMLWPTGWLRQCSLARATPLDVAIDGDRPAAFSVALTCAAERTLALQPAREPRLASCTLAERVTIETIPCAADEVSFDGGHLQGCALAEPHDFGALPLPAGTTMRFRAAPDDIAEFTLPAALRGQTIFYLWLPGGTTVSVCAERRAIDRLRVDQSTSVEIGGVKLTGDIFFNCGRFESGGLAQPIERNGETWPQGRMVTREDLYLPEDGPI